VYIGVEIENLGGGAQHPAPPPTLSQSTLWRPAGREFSGRHAERSRRKCAACARLKGQSSRSPRRTSAGQCVSGESRKIRAEGQRAQLRRQSEILTQLRSSNVMDA